MGNGAIKALKKLLGKNVVALFYRSLWFLSDESFIKLVYRLRMGRRLDLENPTRFNEKIQWLKLNDHRPIYTSMADKVAMRRFVEDRLGPGYTVPLIGVYESFDEIDFQSLPAQFVMKTSHDSGSYIICKDKGSFDLKSARKVMTRSLHRNYYRTTREWQYKDIPHRIVIERFMANGENPLTDYKFFCFNGKCEFLYIMPEAVHGSLQTILDCNFNRLPFTMEDKPSNIMPKKPDCLGRMIEIAQELSHNVPFLRVDMYLVNGEVYVGELTFYHYGGYIPFCPDEWDVKLGGLIHLDVEKGV